MEIIDFPRKGTLVCQLNLNLTKARTKGRVGMFEKEDGKLRRQPGPGLTGSFSLLAPFPDLLSVPFCGLPEVKCVVGNWQ